MPRNQKAKGKRKTREKKHSTRPLTNHPIYFIEQTQGLHDTRREHRGVQVPKQGAS